MFNAIERLASLYQVQLRRAAAAHDLKLVQLEVLHFLDACNRYSDTPGAIAAYLGRTKGTISQTLRALVGKKLIRKQTDPEDARVVHCAITPEGRRIVDDTRPPSSIAAALDHWPDKRVAKTGARLDALVETLRQAAGFKSFGTCDNCQHARVQARGTVCGLTDDVLRDHEARQICVHHNNDGL